MNTFAQILFQTRYLQRLISSGLSFPKLQATLIWLSLQDYDSVPVSFINGLWTVVLTEAAINGLRPDATEYQEVKDIIEYFELQLYFPLA
jgi:hypothetical protein